MKKPRSLARDSFPLLLAASLAASLVASASGQDAPGGAPAAPLTPPPPPVAVSADPLAERLRKMEEMNQRLLLQFDGVAKQNAALTRRVEELSKKLDGPAQPAGDPGNSGGGGGGGGGSAPTVSEDAARPSRFPGGASGSPGTGGSTGAGAGAGPAAGRDTSAPSMTEDAARPSRLGASGTAKATNLLKLSTFYDPQKYGYLMRSEDGEFELRFNGLLQADARIYQQQNQSPVISDIDIPRMRLYFSGRMTKPIEYQLSLQRSTNSLDMLNAWLNFHFDDRLQVRFGRYKAPFTYEWYKISIWEMWTPDRSPFALNFGPNRQVGLMGWGFLFDERLEYSVGVFDGPRNSYQDSNYAKDVMALLDYKPFYRTDSPLKNFGFGGSLDQGHQNNPAVPQLLRTSTSASGNSISSPSGDNLIAVPFLAFNSNVRERGERELWELHATYFYKGLSLLGVWDSGRNDFGLTTAGARPVHLPVSGYFVQAAYLLTGETRQRQGLIDPIHPFDLRRGKFGLGALEVQARFSELGIGRQVFTGGLADPNLWTNQVEMVDVGFLWYLNKNVKFYFDWEHAMFAQPVSYAPGQALQKTSDLFWLRLQLYL